MTTTKQENSDGASIYKQTDLNIQLDSNEKRFGN